MFDLEQELQLKLEPLDLSKGQLSFHPDIKVKETYLVVRQGKKMLGYFINRSYGLDFIADIKDNLNSWRYDSREFSEIYRVVR